MEVNFNPSQVAKPGDTQRVARRRSAGIVSDNTAQADVDSLERRLNDMPLVRSEKVDAARTKVSDLKYPPEELLNGIAHLLAMRIK